jgi:hypothetical protein
MPIRNYNKKIYEQDFPGVGSYNWKVVYIKEYKHKIAGVLLHDGKFITNGVLFDKHEFKVVGPWPPEPPLFRVPKLIKNFFWKIYCYSWAAPKLWVEIFILHKWNKK